MKSIYLVNHKIVALILLSVTLIQFSCKKGWLDAKPNKALVVPTTIYDYQAILDNNTGSTLFNNNQPSLSEIGAGDFYLLYNSWQGLVNVQERNTYLWNQEIFSGETGYDWNDTYNRILNANIVLDGIDKVPYDATSKIAWNNVKGTALFYRSYDFWCLAQEFSKTYDVNSANIDLGIPLRTSSDINIRSIRGTVQETYDKIINDLLSAKILLPNVPVYPTRPSKAAVFGLLSRVYLTEGNFEKSLLYADSCLQLSKDLLDFNTISTTAPTPIARFNKEVIYHHTLENYSAFVNSTPTLIVDSVLYKSYSSNDLRKQIYFKTVSGLTTRKASYSGKTTPFGGIATDEVYLIRAECYARLNNVFSAMEDLNTLLSTRWVTGTFTPYTVNSSSDALSKILIERRKELVFRGLRWSDLRRLNKDPKTAVTLSRLFNGKNYILNPNSNLYVLPIPLSEIQSSNIQQNIR